MKKSPKQLRNVLRNIAYQQIHRALYEMQVQTHPNQDGKYKTLSLDFDYVTLSVTYSTELLYDNERQFKLDVVIYDGRFESIKTGEVYQALNRRMTSFAPKDNKTNYKIFDSMFTWLAGPDMLCELAETIVEELEMIESPDDFKFISALRD